MLPPQIMQIRSFPQFLACGDTNMSSPFQITITTTAHIYCTERFSLQLPIFLLEPISLLWFWIIELRRCRLGLSVQALRGIARRTCRHPSLRGVGGAVITIGWHAERVSKFNNTVCKCAWGSGFRMCNSPAARGVLECPFEINPLNLRSFGYYDL